jgi:hypothetical protein
MIFSIVNDAFTTEMLVERRVVGLLNDEVKFQFLAAASLNMTAFRYIATCSFVKVDRRLKGAYCLHN